MPSFKDFQKFEEFVAIVGEHTDDDMFEKCTSTVTNRDDIGNGNEDSQSYKILNIEKKNISEKQDALHAPDTLH